MSKIPVMTKISKMAVIRHPHMHTRSLACLHACTHAHAPMHSHACSHGLVSSALHAYRLQWGKSSKIVCTAHKHRCTHHTYIRTWAWGTVSSIRACMYACVAHGLGLSSHSTQVYIKVVPDAVHTPVGSVSGSVKSHATQCVWKESACAAQACVRSMGNA